MGWKEGSGGQPRREAAATLMLLPPPPPRPLLSDAQLPSDWSAALPSQHRRGGPSYRWRLLRDGLATVIKNSTLHANMRSRILYDHLLLDSSL